MYGELERMWKEKVVVYFKVLPTFACKNYENISQVTRPPSTYFNSGLFEYGAFVTTTRLRLSVNSLVVEETNLTTKMCILYSFSFFGHLTSRDGSLVI
jgi:hypothetical protein